MEREGHYSNNPAIDIGFEDYDEALPDTQENFPTRNEPNENFNETEIRDCSQDYNWTKVIGQGTFGTVFQAVCLNTGRQVAIKKVF